MLKPTRLQPQLVPPTYEIPWVNTSITITVDISTTRYMYCFCSAHECCPYTTW